MTGRAETVQLADERTILGAYAMLQRGLPDFFDTEGPDAHTINDAMASEDGEPNPGTRTPSATYKGPRRPPVASFARR
jgi:hypothetical protein